MDEHLHDRMHTHMQTPPPFCCCARVLRDSPSPHASGLFCVAVYSTSRGIALLTCARRRMASGHIPEAANISEVDLLGTHTTSDRRSSRQAPRRQTARRNRHDVAVHVRARATIDAEQRRCWRRAALDRRSVQALRHHNPTRVRGGWSDRPLAEGKFAKGPSIPARNCGQTSTTPKLQGCAWSSMS